MTRVAGKASPEIWGAVRICGSPSIGKISEPPDVLHSFVLIYIYLYIGMVFRIFFGEPPIICMVWCNPIFWMMTQKLHELKVWRDFNAWFGKPLGFTRNSHEYGTLPWFLTGGLQMTVAGAAFFLSGHPNPCASCLHKSSPAHHASHWVGWDTKPLPFKPNWLTWWKPWKQIAQRQECIMTKRKFPQHIRGK